MDQDQIIHTLNLFLWCFRPCSLLMTPVTPLLHYSDLSLLIQQQRGGILLLNTASIFISNSNTVDTKDRQQINTQTTPGVCHEKSLYCTLLEFTLASNLFSEGFVAFSRTEQLSNGLSQRRLQHLVLTSQLRPFATVFGYVCTKTWHA